MTHIIAIANQKGGVGKTTTAVNLAACLAAGQRRTLLVDMDSQGSATSAIGIDRNDLQYTLYDIICLGHEPYDAITPTAFEKLSLMPSNISLSGVEIELSDIEGWQHRLDRAVQAVAGDFDYVIIDGPPSLGLLQVMTFVAARQLVIPVQCEFLALEGLTLLLDSIARIQRNLNPELNLMGILMTMYAHTNLSRQVTDDVREHFGDKVFRAIIPRNVRLSEAPSFGQPIILYDFKSAGSRAYIQLCEEILNVCEKTSAGTGTERPPFGQYDPAGAESVGDGQDASLDDAGNVGIPSPGPETGPTPGAGNPD